MVKASQGAVLDASLISSAARPNREIVFEADNQVQPVIYEDGSQPSVTLSETQSADPDAT
jgi:transposase, IS5 family